MHTFVQPKERAPKRVTRAPLQQSYSASNVLQPRAPHNRQSKKPEHLSYGLEDDKENYSPVYSPSVARGLTLSYSAEVISCASNSNDCSIATSTRPLAQSCDTAFRKPPQIEIEDRPKCILPLTNSATDVATIDVHVMAKLLTGYDFGHTYEKIIIVDCRFPYEYQGGHINGAININRTQDLEEYFLGDKNSDLMKGGDKICIIFHCEYSSHRGPKMYRHLRKLDREMNTYPNLTWPEMYLLEGGYKNFFQWYRHLCYPDQYVEMRDPNYLKEMKEGMKEHLRNLRKFRSRSCSDLDLSHRRMARRHQRACPSNDAANYPIKSPSAASNTISLTKSQHIRVTSLDSPFSINSHSSSPEDTNIDPADMMDIDSSPMAGPCSTYSYYGPVTSPYSQHAKSCSELDFGARQRRKQYEAQNEVQTSPIAVAPMPLCFDSIPAESRQHSPHDYTPRPSRKNGVAQALSF